MSELFEKVARGAYRGPFSPLDAILLEYADMKTEQMARFTRVVNEQGEPMNINKGLLGFDRIPRLVYDEVVTHPKSTDREVIDAVKRRFLDSGYDHVTFRFMDEKGDETMVALMRLRRETEKKYGLPGRW